LFAGLSKHVDLRLVSRLEFGSGAVSMRYEPWGLLARVDRIVEQLGQIQWKYSDPTRRVRSNVVSVTGHTVFIGIHEADTN
jgi:hypothetical protein